MKEGETSLLGKMIRDQIKKIIAQIAGINEDEVVLEHPTESEFGDYSTNIAMRLAKDKKTNPKNIAQELIEKINASVEAKKIFKKVELAGSGFINFYLLDELVVNKVGDILECGASYGNAVKPQNKKVLVEFISANPTGKLHLGHGRNAFYGDALCNVLSSAGFLVTREYYQNDAKASAQIKNLGKTALGQGEQYKSEYLDNILASLKSEITKIKEKYGEAGLPTEAFAEAGYIVGQAIFEDLKRFIEKDLKIKFDDIFYEQLLYDNGQIEAMDKWLRSKELIYEKDGAVWLKTSAYGDDEDRVVVKSDGTPTYLLPDVAYHKNKFDRDFDKLITILGADHQGHIKKLLAVQKILGYEGIFQMLFCQMVMLKEGQEAKKMSKRAGTVVYLDWLVKEVGLDAARFMFLMRSLESHMDFDVELAKEQSSKNPVFYVQYAHARISSVLSKVNSQSEIRNSKILKLLTHPAELSLIKELMKLPEIVADTASDYQIQRLPNYALKVASVFHKFYDECHIIGQEENLMQARLALAKATQIVLKNVLSLLGVSAPEKM